MDVHLLTSPRGPMENIPPQELHLHHLLHQRLALRNEIASHQQQSGIDIDTNSATGLSLLEHLDVALTGK